MSVNGDARGLYRRTLLAAPAILGVAPLGGRLAVADGPRKGGTLRAALYANPSSLDPMTGNSGADHIALYPIFARLIDWEPDSLRPKPGLAESWSFADPRSLVLNLRTSVLFHDGTAFDAAAVKANLDRMLMHPRSNLRGDLASLAAVEVATPSRVVLKLKYPDTAMPLILSDRAGMMASPASFAGGADINRRPVGAGAMEFVRWDDGDKIVLRRNQHYWQADRPYLDGIEFKVMTDTNVGVRSVVAGQNDFVARVSPQQVPNLKRRSDLVLLTGQTLYVEMLYFNYGRPPLGDVRLRQAVNYAIDRDAYNAVVTAQMGEIGSVLLPQRHWAFDAQAAGHYGYDPDRAKALVAQAGFAGGIDIHSVHYSDQLSVQRMEILSDMLRKVGFKFKESVGSIAQANQWWQEGTGDIHLSAWTGRPDPSFTYAALFLKDAVYNAGHAEPSPALTQAIAESRSVDDIAARKLPLAQVQRLEREAALCAPLAFEPEVVLHAPKVKGYVSNLIGKPRFDDVYLDA